MGQTLPNGIYLPAEGERNCYDGLEGNWRSLDSLISTVAGKASATHTHGNITNDGKVGTTANLPLITGTGGAITAGAFGNQANTFCEGNDSRLSDARTPVAHTHTKSDVTDLLNSNFIPSANNFYDLGSSSYQWNNLYAKNYYYNGVAWGVDKTNVWTNTNYFTLSMHQKGFTSRSQTPVSSEFGSHGILDVNNNSILSFNYANRNTGARDISIRVYNNVGNANGVGVFKDPDDRYSFRSIDPNDTVELGTSTNKWKSLNGINPGALSLPDYNNYIDVTSSIPVASLDGSTLIQLNDYLADKTGWLSIVIDDAAGNFITATQGRAGGATVFNNSRTFHTGAQSNGFISVFFPIIAGLSKPVLIKASSLIQMRFYPCQGNV